MELKILDQMEEKLHFTDPSWGSDLSGAYRAMFSIKDAVSIFHSPAGCQAYVMSLLIQQVQSYGMIGTTALSERDVIFGGEEVLRRALIKTMDVYNPELICIIESTVSRLIGDDVEGISTMVKSEEDIGIPIFSVETSSIEGDHITGYNMVLDALVQNVMEPAEVKLENTVNLIGIQEDAPYGKADLNELCNLLSALKINVHVPFLCEVTTQQIRTAPQASLNVVLADNLGLSAAKLMEDQFNVPYLTCEYPIGITNTSQFLFSIAEFFQIPRERVESLIEKEMDEVTRFFSSTYLSFDELIQANRAGIISDSGMAISFTRFLKEDLGIEPAFVCFITYGKESLSKLEALEVELDMDINLLMKPNYIHIRRAFEEICPELVLGGCLEKFTLEQLGFFEAGGTFIPIPAWPAFWGVFASHRPFVGFKGIVNNTESIVNGFVNAPTQTQFREMRLLGDY
jgi:nitrogenase molybdenum-iron protein beta chain